MSDKNNPHWFLVERDLRAGQLNSLALYLRRSGGQIDPCLATYIADLIDGSLDKTCRRLTLGRHPDRKSNKPIKEEWFERQKYELKVSDFVGMNGGFVRGMFDSAISATQVEFGISRSTITSIWKRKKHLSRIKVPVSLELKRKNESNSLA